MTSPTPKLSALVLTLALAACDRSAPAPQVLASPPEARLLAVYDRACATCHEAAGSGAPRRGDAAAWAQRAQAGPRALVASVRQGKGAMPPMGWCPECSDADFGVLVDYLRTVKP